RGFTPRSAGSATDIGAFESGATGRAQSPGGEGGGGGPLVDPIAAAIVKVKGHKQVRVTDAVTGAFKFSVYPFGKSFRGAFQIQLADLDGDGVADLIARRALPHKKFATRVFSGASGKRLSVKVV